MDLQDKLSILADAAKYDASCASSGAKRANAGGLGNSDGTGICHSYTPDGRCVSLLKILLTNHCIFDCAYCINRVSSNVQRARFTPEEVVYLTLEFYRRNYIEGLFLSSGVIGSPDATMEQMIEAARALREDHKFGGYIHLKAVAGCSPELTARAGLYADRLSANIEMPREADLAALAPAKTMEQIEESMAAIKGRIDETKDSARTPTRAKPPTFSPAGQSTQMVIGATDSTDSDILTTSTRLYHQYGLRRVYYTAFSPIPHSDPRLPSQAPPLVREHRLYQADWLLRHYGFNSAELFSPAEQNLRTDISPKLAWALKHLDVFPVDINSASREMLLRVPGVGVRNADRIISARRHTRLRLDDLRKLRVNMQEAQYFVVTADGSVGARAIDKPGLVRRFAPQPQQLTIFSAMFGEL
jgi:putative DNA modification/repair radical SAM protein